VNGLPEAAVEDLALFDSGGMRLLRAAISARGVWELELDAMLTELTYVRAHADDLRRRTRALELQRDGKTARSWHGSPDVRPRPAPAVVAEPTSLPWQRTKAAVKTESETLRRFQAALRSQKNDPRSRPTGVWDLYFEEVLRDNGAPEDGSKVVSIDSAFWQSVMVAPHNTAEPWGSGTPLEADLYELAPKLDEGDADRASCTMPRAALKVDVVIHRRAIAAIEGSDVRVTLLHWTDPASPTTADPDHATTWFSGNVPWTAAVNEVLNSTDGTTSQTFAGGWAFTGSPPNLRQTLTGQRLDNMRSGVATFDLDLSGVGPNAVVLVVAVIRADGDIALAPAPLRDLALNNPTVAVRSIRTAT
jgi:hypothetical protein